MKPNKQVVVPDATLESRQKGRVPSGHFTLAEAVVFVPAVKESPGMSSHKCAKKCREVQDTRELISIP